MDVAEQVQLGKYHGEVLLAGNTLSYGFSHEGNKAHVGQEMYDRLRACMGDPNYSADVRVNSFDAGSNGTATTVEATVRDVNLRLQFGERVTQVELTNENFGHRERAADLLEEIFE